MMESKATFRKMMAVGVGSFSVLSFAAGVAVRWFFRDGLAPGMVVSSGAEAFRRAFDGFFSEFLEFAAAHSATIFPSLTCAPLGVSCIPWSPAERRLRV